MRLSSSLIAVAVAGLCLIGCATASDATTVFGEQLSIERSHRLAQGAGSGDSTLIDGLRDQRRLEEARAEALHQLAGDAENPAFLWRAARSLADTALSHPDEDVRGQAALLGLEHARRAAELAPDHPDCLAQRAFLLGITTHLQPMSERAGHARQTIEAAERALALRPGDPLALHTLAVVNLRLATLPWIARTMAKDVPASSLADAENLARRAVEAEASLGNSLLLAKVLIAQERSDEARAVLLDASRRPNAHPRDLIHRPQIIALLEEIQ